MKKAIKIALSEMPSSVHGFGHKNGANKDRKTKRHGANTAYNNGMAVQGGRPPFSQIAKVICGLACVSVHLNPVSTPSLRSVGHSLQAHGTQAQIYLATSPYLNVVRHGFGGKTKIQKTAR